MISMIDLNLDAKGATFAQTPIEESKKLIGSLQGGLCRARHNPPYAELNVMPS